MVIDQFKRPGGIIRLVLGLLVLTLGTAGGVHAETEKPALSIKTLSQ